jgi:flagellar hook-basal body complex protein FliE
MVAAEEANIQTQLTAAVRNNALQAFQQIMGMQL